MKYANNFLENGESPNGDECWKNLPFKKLGGSKNQIGNDKYNLSLKT